MTSDLESAIARHAEAERLHETALAEVRKAEGVLAKLRQATAEAKGRHADAKAKADDLMACAARGKSVPAAELVAARDAVAEPAAALDIAVAAETPARTAVTKAAGLARSAETELEQARAILHRERRIDAAHRLDETVAKAREIIAELAAIGPHDATPYHLHFSTRKPEWSGFDGQDIHAMGRTAEGLETSRPAPRRAA